MNAHLIFPQEEVTPRRAFELRAMKHFNATRQVWHHLVDAGELGILEMEFRNHWEFVWRDLETIPAE